MADHTFAVILNYRTPDATVRAVRSLCQGGFPASAAIVVDNGSEDGSADRLRRELPDVRVIAADANDGFSAGCNLGIRQALALDARHVLLLNSDVTVPPGTVAALERALRADAGLGIVGPAVIARDDGDRLESLGISYHAWTGRMRHRGHGRQAAGLAPSEVRDVDGVSGCAMMIRREVFEEIGLLDEAYFFGFEDLDFCLRARAAGFRTACVGTARILHEGRLSIGRRSPARIYFATRNHLLLASRVPGSQPLPARWLRAAAIVALNLAHVLLTSEVPRTKGLRAVLLGVRDHMAGRYGHGPG